jgi:hypothetical protein
MQHAALVQLFAGTVGLVGSGVGEVALTSPDTLQPMMLVLLLSAVLMLLGTTVGALVLLWRTMNDRDRIQRKLDWICTPHDRRKTVAWPRPKA